MGTKEENMMLRFARQTTQTYKIANRRLRLNNKIGVMKQKDKELETKSNEIFKKRILLEQKLMKAGIPEKEIVAIKETGRANIIT
jgi:hypothetical protein